MQKPANLLFLIAIIASPVVSGFEAPAENEEQYLCYARAMIGFDSVINSRLGVPAEHALDLAVLPHSPISTDYKVYSKAMLKTIWDAYSWQESPHNYAVKTFFTCASEQRSIQSAKSDWIVTDF